MADYSIEHWYRRPTTHEKDESRDFGGAEGDRTLDLRIANAALSQLSYCPTGRELSASWNGAPQAGDAI